MAQHRTREQKIQAQQRRAQTYSLDQILNKPADTATTATPLTYKPAEKKPLITSEQMHWLRTDFGKTAFGFGVVLLSMFASWLVLSNKLPFISSLL